jgi:hypothetical protein
MISAELQETIKARVQRGAELLDRECPEWENNINTAELYMGAGSTCILGQLYGLYFTGFIKLLKGSLKDSVDNGFDLADSQNRDLASATVYFEELGEAWKEEIAQRKN